ncbi:hypothetical protein BD414DRAFT_498740 [Trametes punicea]|nr:hypothetical protein BD414DRAFT_498740 [Trametes punicea]
MAGNQPQHQASRRGRFIGSSGMVFNDQTAADVYFGNYWQHLLAGRRLERVAIICTSWGMSMALIQHGIPPGPFNPFVLGFTRIIVDDNGIHPPQGADMVPPAIQIVQAGSMGIHWVNGIGLHGRRLPWHRRITLRREDGGTLHYHQHEDRVGHRVYEVPPIRPEHEGAYFTFNRLRFGTQIQNYRRIQTV